MRRKGHPNTRLGLSDLNENRNKSTSTITQSSPAKYLLTHNRAAIQGEEIRCCDLKNKEEEKGN